MKRSRPSSPTTSWAGSTTRSPRSSGDRFSVCMSALDRAAVMPATICRLKKMYMTSGGMVISKMSVNSRFHWLSVWLWKLYRVSWTVTFVVAGQEVQRVLEVVEDDHRLHHDHRDHHRLEQRQDRHRRTAAAGRRRRRSPPRRAPGGWWHERRNSRMQNEARRSTSIRIMPGIVLNSPSACSTQIVGTTAGGTISPASTKKLTTGFQPRLAALQHVADHGGEDDHDGRH